MSQFAPFSPAYKTAITLSVTAASVDISIPPSKQVRLVNLGDEVVYVVVGNGAQTATDEDFLIPPKAVEVITRREDFKNVAVLSTVTGSSVNIMAGEGW